MGDGVMLRPWFMKGQYLTGFGCMGRKHFRNSLELRTDRSHSLRMLCPACHIVPFPRALPRFDTDSPARLSELSNWGKRGGGGGLVEGHSKPQRVRFAAAVSAARPFVH